MIVYSNGRAGAADFPIPVGQIGNLQPIGNRLRPLKRARSRTAPCGAGLQPAADFQSTLVRETRHPFRTQIGNPQPIGNRLRSLKRARSRTAPCRAGLHLRWIFNPPSSA
jgi:hypothetical protein